MSVVGKGEERPNIESIKYALPFGNNPNAFLFVILITLGISGAMLVFFRFRRWI